MMNGGINIRTSEKIVPMIYAYSTPEIARHNGWIKIGYTEQDVGTRIKQQTHTANIDWKLEWQGNAIYEDGSGEAFRDTDFHAFLRSNGVEAQTEERNEWFHISPDESEKLFYKFRSRRNTTSLSGPVPYSLRNEQKEAVARAKDYFRLNPKGEFLWNAKPRFGKTLSVYDLCKGLNVKNALIVTNRPAIANSWYDDYRKFLGEESGFKFISEADALKGKDRVLTATEFETIVKSNPLVKRIEFVSLQDLKGSVYFGGKFDKLKHICDTKWDILVIDEAHEGIDTMKTDVAFDHIDRKYTLHLSGTPFKALASDKFPEEAIYNWTYMDEQNAKENWVGEPGSQNPYERLPKLCMYTYQMSEIVRSKVEQGVVIDGNYEDYAFDLNEFFKTNSNGTFTYNGAVNAFLDALTTQIKYPFSTEELRNELKHTLWLLNRVDSAKALAKKLQNHAVFGQYKIILAAGDGVLDDETEKQKSIDKVRKAISKHDKTITISVGQLTTGVTIPEWSAVLMLSNLSSPSLYMQAAFRAQNPYTFKSGTEYRRKETAYVFDFDPARTLDIFEKFANDLSSDSTEKKDSDSRKRHVRELLNFFPVYGEEENGEMIELDAERVLSIPRTLRSKEVVRSGFMSNYLFQNISNVFVAPSAITDIISKMEPRKDEGPIAPGRSLYVDSNGNVQIPEDKVIGTAVDLFGKKVYDNPDILEDLLVEAESVKEVPEVDAQVKRFVEEYEKKVADKLFDTAKQKYGKALSPNAEKDLRRKIKFDAETSYRKTVENHKIAQSTLDLELDKELDKANNKAEEESIRKKYEEKKNKISETFAKTVADGLNNLSRNAGKDIVNRVETDKIRREVRVVEDKVKDHLRGFTRTIPSFLMAYGEENSVTLATFDQIIPPAVFKEVTSITIQQFRLLRDGGSVIKDGIKEYYEGHLFDEVVFNDSVREFMNLKRKLADYFNESNEEDIFDYIPPQKTNQIFTPKKVVRDMVNRLEKENPGCFDDDTKTFADLYMKSGLYIAEIVKRLYSSKRMKVLFPDDSERLNHIFANQVYGLAPTEIIYRISRNFILGFTDIKIEKDNIRLCDTLKYAKEGTLEETLEKVFLDNYECLDVKSSEADDDPNIIVGDYSRKSDFQRRYTVTRRAKSVKQPPGGYVNPSTMEKIAFTDGITLYDESISPATMGMVVDYMVRFTQGASVSEAFSISLRGAKLCNRLDEAEHYASKITGVDDESILNACRLVWFDQVYRTGRCGFGDPLDTVPDHETCENVRTMIDRTGHFLKFYGGIVESGPVFPGGYSEIVVKGDGDFTTEDIMWDLKVSKNPPTVIHTLQVAMYYIMAKHSTVKSYVTLEKIGIFNPRLNVAYVLDMSKVDGKIIDEIESEVIGYAK